MQTHAMSHVTLIFKKSLTYGDVLNKVSIHVNINIVIRKSLRLIEIDVYKSYVEALGPLRG